MSQDFRSDNICPPSEELLSSLGQHCLQWHSAYGDDEITSRLEARLVNLFEHDVSVFPVVSGTAANALALAQISGRHGQILCHDTSHIYVDECGAVEFFTPGNRLKPLQGAHGMLVSSTILGHVSMADDVHQLRTTALSISQSTECGTYYTAREVKDLADVAKSKGVTVHMDGTRLASAIAASGSNPSELTWRAGVDVLCLGATKGGAIGAEVVIFFDRAMATDFKRIMKRAGHLPSRIWFMAAQIEAYLADDLWIRHAAHANKMASHLADFVGVAASLRIAHPISTNMVFLELSEIERFRVRAEGFQFYDIDDGNGRMLSRFVTSHATSRSDIDSLQAALLQIVSRSVV